MHPPLPLVQITPNGVRNSSGLRETPAFSSVHRWGCHEGAQISRFLSRMIFLALSVTFWSMPLFLIWEKGAVSSMFRDLAAEIQAHNEQNIENIRTSNDVAELTSHTTLGIPKRGRDYFLKRHHFLRIFTKPSITPTIRYNSMSRHAVCFRFAVSKNVLPDCCLPVWLLTSLQAFPPSSRLCHQQVVVWPQLGSMWTQVGLG